MIGAPTSSSEEPDRPPTPGLLQLISLTLRALEFMRKLRQRKLQQAENNAAAKPSLERPLSAIPSAKGKPVAKGKAFAKAKVSPSGKLKACSKGVDQQYIPYETLKTRPAGVDISRLQVRILFRCGEAHLFGKDYLNPEEFQQVFGMDKEAFAKLPPWTQGDKKKRVGLF